MSQFILTPEEDQLVLDALRSIAARYTAMYGVTDPALEALVAKISPVEAPVVEVPAEVPAEVSAEVPAEVSAEVPAEVPAEEE